MDSLVAHTGHINEMLERYGVRFGLYADGVFKEQLFPFDAIPRIVPAHEFAVLRDGLAQRVDALNAFLRDVYSNQHILNDGTVPRDFVLAAEGYLPQVAGIEPPQGIYSHISGLDLVKSVDGIWFVLEDNLRIPSGASYPLIARGICRAIDPAPFSNTPVIDNRSYPHLLGEMMRHVACDGVSVVLTPGRYNAAFFEHSYLAERLGYSLAFPKDLFVENAKLYFNDMVGRKHKVGVVYRRITDEYLDPATFRPESLIGVPNLMDAYRAGNVAIVNAPGNGVADDKGLYYFVPKMIKYYLDQEPILLNAPTYLPTDPDDLGYIMSHFDRLIIKDVAEAGGYGVRFVDLMTAAEADAAKNQILAEPRRFIAQEVIDFETLEVAEPEGRVRRHADLRAYILSGKTTKVWESGLTRFSRTEGSRITNSSQGGGFKDTWVLSR